VHFDLADYIQLLLDLDDRADPGVFRFDECIRESLAEVGILILKTLLFLGDVKSVALVGESNGSATVLRSYLLILGLCN